MLDASEDFLLVSSLGDPTLSVALDDSTVAVALNDAPFIAVVL